ncbi:MAG: hypothetical protein WA906_08605 [Pacificimonas sp.]
MGPLVVVLLGAIGVFWYLGLLTPERARLIGGIAAILIGLFILFRGAPFPGLALSAVGGYLFYSGYRQKKLIEPMDQRAARELLGVAPTATVEDIRAAHRLAIASAHPDRGGSDADSAALNEARDVLIAARMKDRK